MRRRPDRPLEREVKWISAKECEALLRTYCDVIFIDLRSGKENAPIPLAVSEILTVSPSQFSDMLRWLPASSSIVLYGASDSCASLLWSTRNIHGGAPVYVLYEDSDVAAGRVRHPA